MKHGQKRKKESAKSQQKASSQKSSKTGSQSKEKTTSQSKEKTTSARPAPIKKAERSAAPSRGDGQKASSGGQGKIVAGAKPKNFVISFSNPAVGNAFKRAIKKYSTALKRLTD